MLAGWQVGRGLWLLSAAPRRPHSMVAGDLELRQEDSGRWFAGQPIYGNILASHPPASMVLLYPWVGRWPFPQARALFAATNALLLAALIVLFARASAPHGAVAQATVACAPLAGEAVRHTLGLGQVGLLSLVPAVFATWLALGQRAKAGSIAVAAGLLLSLVKPAIAVPFVLLAAVGQPFSAALAGIAYAVVTVLAARFQPDGVLSLLWQWFDNSRSWYRTWGAGYGSVPVWLERDMALPAGSGSAGSLLVLAAFATWLFKHRTGDRWLLIGAASLVSRLWTVHRIYDDVVVAPSFVALFRLAADSSREAALRGHAARLFWANAVASLLPVGRSAVLPVLWLLSLLLIGKAVSGPPSVRAER